MIRFPIRGQVAPHSLLPSELRSLTRQLCSDCDRSVSLSSHTQNSSSSNSYRELTTTPRGVSPPSAAGPAWITRTSSGPSRLYCHPMAGATDNALSGEGNSSEPPPRAGKRRTSTKHGDLTSKCASLRSLGENKNSPKPSSLVHSYFVSSLSFSHLINPVRESAPPAPCLAAL